MHGTLVGTSVILVALSFVLMLYDFVHTYIHTYFLHVLMSQIFKVNTFKTADIVSTKWQFVGA